MFRRSKPNDIDVILALNKEFLQYTIDRQFDPELINKDKLIENTGNNLKNRILDQARCIDKPVYVAEINKIVVGYVTGRTLKNKSLDIYTNAILENIFISKDYRRGGIKHTRGTGAKLANQFIMKCKENNNGKVIVEPYAKDVDAICFYKSINFLESKEKSYDSSKIKLELDI